MPGTPAPGVPVLMIGCRRFPTVRKERGGTQRNSHQSAVFGKAGNGTV